MISINDDCGDDNLDDMVFDDFDVGNNEEQLHLAASEDSISSSPGANLNMLEKDLILEYTFSNQYFL